MHQARLHNSLCEVLFRHPAMNDATFELQETKTLDRVLWACSASNRSIYRARQITLLSATPIAHAEMQHTFIRALVLQIAWHP